MSESNDLARDKKITWFIHRLFWRAIVQDKKNFAVSLLNIPPFFLNHAYIPLQVAYIVQAIFQRQFDRVDTYISHIAVATLLTVVLMYFGNRADTYMGVNGSGYIQREAFSNLLNKDYDFYSSQFVGSIGNQVAQLREAFARYVHEFKYVFEKNASIVIFLLAILAFNSWQLFVIALVCISIILGYTIMSSKYRLQYRRADSEASSELAGVESDALSHGAAVKSFAAEDYEMDYAAPVVRKWQKAKLKAWLSLDPSNTIRNVLSYSTVCILLVTTANLYKNNTISLAIVVLVQLYMIRLIATTLEIADLIKQYEQIMGSAYKPAQTMQIQAVITDPDQTKRLPKQPRSIVFENVSFGYHGDKGGKAIDEFSLTINKGERIGLIGYSGAGKTTLTKLILRFMDVTDGSIKIDGVDVREASQHELRQRVAYVPQEPLLFHRSIKENIAYGRPNATEKEILTAAKLAYVDEFASELPKAYETFVGERGVKLSGGQRQRVAIARAILKDAPILVLDEATSALDSRSEKYIQTALWKLMKDRTALVIAHRLSTVQRMDKIIVMDKGAIVQMGSHDELLKQSGIYAELWAHQSGGYIGVQSVDT